MATSRPGYARSTTDGVQTERTYELQDMKKDSEKVPDVEVASTSEYDIRTTGANVETADDLVTKVLHVEDDPSENPATFRVFFLGIGLSVFGSVLQEIFYFKPQTIFVSLVFLTVWAYILGDAMAVLIPRRIGRFSLAWINPGPFNRKEHAAITIMSSAAAQCALATEALAAQELYYGGYPSRAAGIFIVLASQLLGFGMAGILRDIVVHPVRMIWPMTIPVSNLLETIHKDRNETKRKMRYWYAIFLCVFVWEIFPEYIFTTLIGVSVFCLANQNSLTFTYLFGGATGNEGLGMFNWSFDWNYIAPFFSPFWYPLQSSVNCCIGIFGCYILFMALYYGNVWEAQSLPFMSQSLFNITASNSTYYSVYDQSLILNADSTIDFDALQQEGIPYLTATYVGYILTTNMGFTTTIIYMLLWNWDDLKVAWSWCTPSYIRSCFTRDSLYFWRQGYPEERLRAKLNDPNLDPHYKLMLRNGYGEVPVWWWGSVLAGSFAVALGCLYAINSTLPWWGLVLAVVFTGLFTLFFTAQLGMTGFGFNLQPVCQMLAGYMFPGRPLANFYFTCFTYNANFQASLLAKDLRLAQYSHLPPKFTFLIQVMGCVIGGLLNWAIMVEIVQNQSDTLLSIQGTSIWSGQNVQQFNSLAIAWSIAGDMFSVGARYQWCTLAFLLGFLVPVPAYLMYKYSGRGNKLFWSYLNPSIILWFMGNLFVGINSGYITFFCIAFAFQFYVRKYHPKFFVEWNYLLSAAFDGGTQIMVFILTFAVAGGSGVARPFPTWAGNPDLSMTNTDHCMVNPATFA